jgi:hypothetical protein
MRTEAGLTKTQRTLLWYKATLKGPVQRWQRFSTLVTDADAIIACPDPDLVYLHGTPTTEELGPWSKWFETATNRTLVLASTNWLTALKLNAAAHSSLIVTSELHSRYPYLPKLTDEDPKDTWILAFAQLMRFHRLVTTTALANTDNLFTGRIEQIDAAASAEKIVPAIYLIQQYYVPSKAKRAEEMDLALKNNIECPYIDKIILLNESKLKIPICDKVRQTVIGHRLTYLDVLSYIKSQVPNETIVVFSNSDIYMDETLRLLYSVDLQKKFLALLRYEITEKAEPKLFGPRPDSQDTWIVWSTSIDFPLDPEDFNFTFGTPGCDNAITTAMLRKKFTVVNPALSIRTYHLHESNIREYNKTDVIDKPVFLYVDPTGIQEYAVKSDLSESRIKTWSRPPPRSFARPIKYVDPRTAETICNMMKRDTHYTYSIHSANTFNQGYAAEDNQLHAFTGPVFTMPVGLVCDYKNLYVGKHPIWRQEWSNVPITVLTNTISVPTMAAVHFPPPMAGSAAKWFLYYLPQVLKIRKQVEDKPEFLVPVHPDVQRALQFIKWPEEGRVTITPYLPDCQYVSEKVYALTPNSFHDVSAEDIDMLRSMVHRPKETDNNPSVVIVVEREGDPVMSRLFAEEIVKNIFKRQDQGHWTTHIVDANTQTEVRLNLLSKADLVIAQSDNEWEALDWTWVMKPESTVAEVMLDTKPRGDHIHIAAAASVNYVLLGVKREPLPFQRQHLLEDINKTLNMFMFKESLKAQVPQDALPTVVLPVNQKGIHEHAGDTFREMVELWSERGYCHIQRSEDTPYVWWDKIGETLLYDRPTMRWLNNPSYKLALYGNPFPEKATRQDKTWSFWPRSPRLVEQIATRSNSYKNRSIPSIFLGRIENGVQKERRTKQAWAKSVHTFSMPVDSTGGPYKYSQQEYLEMLTQSRFGLCLPGYGPKCNREIEYFATGVVPIVTPGVDMSNYMVPPLRGVHYLFASTPEEVATIVKTTTEDQWTMMSEAGRSWWQRYASAEGLFRFTWGIVRDHLKK